MSKSLPFSPQNKFSHIYVERGARQFELAQSVLARFPQAEIIEIEDYKELFNRSRQDWSGQKESMKLILAVKKDGFLYEGTPVTPNFGQRHYYYNSLVLNCIYDCEYCYLQGMYPSANIVAFVNDRDFFVATDERLRKENPLYLCISYDTDLLAIEQIIPYASRWIEFARERPDLLIELRTKSANFKALEKLSPIPNVILAWTLSPQFVIDCHEHKTPSLAARINALRAAIEAGWRVRVCIDPLLLVSDWQTHYTELVESLFREVDADRLTDISLGVFRMNRDYFKSIKKRRPNSLLFYAPQEQSGSLTSYPQAQVKDLSSFALNLIKQRLPEDRIYVM